MPPLMLRGALTFVFLLTVPVLSSAQTLVRGVVLDLEKKPVDGAVITFDAQFQAGPEPESRRVTKSDNKGAFLFIDLPSGRWKISAKKDDASDEVTVGLSTTQRTEVSLTVRPEREAKAYALQKQTWGLLGFGQRDEARSLVLTTVKADPSLAIAYWLLFSIYVQDDGKAPDARAALQEYLKLEPNGDKADLAKVYLGR